MNHFLLRSMLMAFCFIGLMESQGAIISVRSFGAKGDGVTDDTKAIQNALTKLSRFGGTLSFDNGTFVISKTLVLKTQKSINLVISGVNSTVKSKVNMSFFDISNTSGVNSSIAVRNMRLNGNCDNLCKNTLFDKDDWAFGLLIQDFKLVTIENNHISNIYGSGIMLKNSVLPTSYNSISYQTKAKIRNNTLINVAGLKPKISYYPNGAIKSHDSYGDGIYVSCVKECTISGNTIKQDAKGSKICGRGGIVLEYGTMNCEVVKNIINGYDRNIQVESSQGGHKIRGNTLTGSDLGILICVSGSTFISNNPVTIDSNIISNSELPLGDTLPKIISPRALIYFFGSSPLYANSIVRNNTLEHKNGQRQGSFIFLSQQANLYVDKNIFKGDATNKSQLYFNRGASSFNENTLENLNYINSDGTVQESKNNVVKGGIYSNFLKS
jgi:hypothetical protein